VIEGRGRGRASNDAGGERQEAAGAAMERAVPVVESVHEQLREELKSFRWKRINMGKEIFISLKLSLDIRLTEID
jgi:hypothetical protein